MIPLNGLASKIIAAFWVYIIVSIAFSFVIPVHKRECKNCTNNQEKSWQKQHSN